MGRVVDNPLHWIKAHLPKTCYRVSTCGWSPLPWFWEPRSSQCMALASRSKACVCHHRAEGWRATELWNGWFDLWMTPVCAPSSPLTRAIQMACTSKGPRKYGGPAGILWAGVSLPSSHECILPCTLSSFPSLVPAHPLLPWTLTFYL